MKRFYLNGLNNMNFAIKLVIMLDLQILKGPADISQCLQHRTFPPFFC